MKVRIAQAASEGVGLGAGWEMPSPRTRTVASLDALSTTVWAMHVYFPPWRSWAFRMVRSPTVSFCTWGTGSGGCRSGEGALASAASCEPRGRARSPLLHYIHGPPAPHSISESLLGGWSQLLPT